MEVYNENISNYKDGETWEGNIKGSQNIPL